MGSVILMGTVREVNEMSRYIDADALQRHGQRGGLVHWKDIEDASSIDLDDYVPREFHDKTSEAAKRPQAVAWLPLIFL